MAQFRDFLEEEGLPPDDGRIEFHLPIIRNLGRQPLKTIPRILHEKVPSGPMIGYNSVS